MIEEEKPHFLRDHQGWVIALMIAVGLGIWVIFFWRATTNSGTTSRLCSAIKALIEPQVRDAHIKGNESYKYYAKHPDSLHRLDNFERQLPC